MRVRGRQRSLAALVISMLVLGSGMALAAVPERGTYGGKTSQGKRIGFRVTASGKRIKGLKFGVRYRCGARRFSGSLFQESSDVIKLRNGNFRVTARERRRGVRFYLKIVGRFAPLRFHLFKGTLHSRLSGPAGTCDTGRVTWWAR